MDDNVVNADLNEESLEEFSNHLSSNKIYWNNEQNHGFWTDINKIRYINFSRLNGDSEDDAESTRDESNNSEIQKQNGEVSGV